MNTQKLSTALTYIDDYWDKLTTHTSTGGPVAIDLPHPFVSPSGGQFHNEQFYWDTYFTIIGLVGSKKHLNLAKGMVDNLLFLYQQYQMIPMRNRSYDTGISQPPFLTSMIRLIFDKTRDQVWLDTAMKVAEDELLHYWMNADIADQIPDHMVFEGLSRYADHYLIDQTAEHESGWDMTSRFNNHAFSHIPIDLNSLLYKYEVDLSWWYEQQKNQDQAQHYSELAKVRAQTINRYHYHERKGFFFDYIYPEGKQSSFWSLAGFYPLWAGLATQEQAENVHGHIKKFEQAGGLATTRNKSLLTPFRQWDYPNGWAPLQWIVIQGLSNYGFEETAQRLREKWLELNLQVFEDTGKFWEKYDVVNCQPGQAGRYPTQEGFGWTNGVFVALANQSTK